MKPDMNGRLNGKLAVALVGVLSMALMGCLGWMAKPDDSLSRPEWNQYLLKCDAEQLGIKETLVEIKTDLRVIRADVSTLMRNGSGKGED